jgi:ABC-type sugar transport system permease subunit
VAALLIILFVTMGLAVRAGAYARQWNPADSNSYRGTGVQGSKHESRFQETGFLDACARTFVLVLLSLIGLLALGMMYGNVLGSAGSAP